ncbi:MAG: DUF805 domain-containing protein [Selenomonadaceae bacterium]|nr:DUF805 domain-containing protein [Selenomonadaceae bacterium]
MTNEIMKSETVSENNETFKEKFFTPNGRIGRMTFFSRSILLLLLEFITLFVAGSAAILSLALGSDPTPSTPIWFDIVTAIVMFGALVPQYCLNSKRLHDIGKDETLAKIFLGVSILISVINSGFPSIAESMPYMIISGISMLGFYMYLLFMKGEEVTNEYGAAK